MNTLAERPGCSAGCAAASKRRRSSVANTSASPPATVSSRAPSSTDPFYPVTAAAATAGSRSPRRGHGDSSWDPAGRYDMEELAADLLTVRDRYSRQRPPVAVGASMGGVISQIIAVRRCDFEPIVRGLDHLAQAVFSSLQNADALPRN